MDKPEADMSSQEKQPPDRITDERSQAWRTYLSSLRLPPAASACLLSPTAWARFLMIVACAVLSIAQCSTLLQLYQSEPVSVALSFTPWEDVQVPAVTICPPEYSWRRHTFLNLVEVPVSRAIWKADSVTIGELLDMCEPGCETNETVGYPGGYASVKIGMWRTWISQEVGAVCHTLTPNITWGQLVDISKTKKTELRIKLNEKMLRIRPQGFHVFFHSRRRPVVTGHGIRGLQEDANFDQPGDRQIDVEVGSNIIDRESLARASCNAELGYYFETCSVQCTHVQLADKFNCSTPDMMEDFPNLEQCPKKTLLFIEHTHMLSSLASKCGCLPSCREHRMTATITHVEDLSLSGLPHDPRSIFVISLAPIPEIVATERLSYLLPSLLSEMGGFISLMLGVSVLSVSELVTELLTRMKRNWLAKIRGDWLLGVDGAAWGWPRAGVGIRSTSASASAGIGRQHVDDKVTSPASAKRERPVVLTIDSDSG